jgi:hypothetical protein
LPRHLRLLHLTEALRRRYTGRATFLATGIGRVGSSVRAGRGALREWCITDEARANVRGTGIACLIGSSKGGASNGTG